MSDNTEGPVAVDSSADQKIRRAVDLARNGQPDLALDLLRSSPSTDERAPWLAALGYCREKLGDAAVARYLYRECLRLAPNNVGVAARLKRLDESRDAEMERAKGMRGGAVRTASGLIAAAMGTLLAAAPFLDAVSEILYVVADLKPIEHMAAMMASGVGAVLVGSFLVLTGLAARMRRRRAMAMALGPDFEGRGFAACRSCDLARPKRFKDCPHCGAPTRPPKAKGRNRLADVKPIASSEKTPGPAGEGFEILEREHAPTIRRAGLAGSRAAVLGLVASMAVLLSLAALTFHQKHRSDPAAADPAPSAGVAARQDEANPGGGAKDERAQPSPSADRPAPVVKHGSIVTAAKAGDLDAVERFVEGGASVDEQDRCYGNTALHWAAFAGDAAMVEYLLARKPNLESRSFEQGATPLLCAVRADQENVVGLLLQAGANAKALDDFGRGALHRAALEGASASVASLIAAGVDPNAVDYDGKTPLDLAGGDPPRALAKVIGNGNAEYEMEKAKELLAKAASPHRAGATSGLPKVFQSLRRAAKYGDAAEIERCLGAGVSANARDPGAGDTPLHLAVRNRQASAARMLLDRGATVGAINNDGQTPLFVALVNRDEPMVDLLVSKGADTDGLFVVSAERENRYFFDALLKRCDPPKCRDTDGFPPLHSACKGGCVDFVRELVERGADVNARTLRGYTPLACAAEGASPHAKEIAEILIAKGAAVDPADDEGRTPLFDAAYESDKDAFDAEGFIEFLLSKGAKADARPNDGWTPLHAAAENGNVDVASLLLDRGAKVDAKDADGITPAGAAQAQEKWGMLDWLYAHGAAKLKIERLTSDELLARFAKEGFSESANWCSLYLGPIVRREPALWTKKNANGISVSMGPAWDVVVIETRDGCVRGLAQRTVLDAGRVNFLRLERFDLQDSARVALWSE